MELYGHDRQKVMVIDNDMDTVEPLRLRLQERGLKIVHLREGANAKQIVKTERPALIIMDINLPDVDGKKLIRELKDDWDTKGIPIFVVSNYVGRLDRKTGPSVDAVYSKPIDCERLIAHAEGVAAGLKIFTQSNM